MTLGGIMTCYLNSKSWNVTFFWSRAANIKKARGSYFSEEVIRFYVLFLSVCVAGGHWKEREGRKGFK